MTDHLFPKTVQSLYFRVIRLSPGVSTITPYFSDASLLNSYNLFLFNIRKTNFTKPCLFFFSNDIRIRILNNPDTTKGQIYRI